MGGAADPGVGTEAPAPLAAHVAVVTDGAASLPPRGAEALGVTVVPMTVVVGGHEHPDGDLGVHDVVAGTGPVSTSAPSPGAFVAALGALGGRPALVTTVSRRMSSSYDSAVTASRYVPAQDVRLLDSGTAAGGQGLVVIAAARAAARGHALDEVAAAARRAAASVRLVAVLDDLDHLARSGRVPGVAARAGRSIGIRPLFEFRRGTVRPLRPAGGTRAAVERIASLCRRDARPDHRLRAAVLETGSPGPAARLETLVREAAGTDADVYRAPFSAVMAAHTGPGLTGLAWWWEPAKPPRP